MKTMIENDFVFRAGPKMAAVLGINEALVLGMVDYWINKNRENNINYKNGRYWTFNSIKNGVRDISIFGARGQLREFLNH